MLHEIWYSTHRKSCLDSFQVLLSQTSFFRVLWVNLALTKRVTSSLLQDSRIILPPFIGIGQHLYGSATPVSRRFLDHNVNYQIHTHTHTHTGFPNNSSSKVQETQFQSLDWEDPLEEEMALTPIFLPGKSHRQRSLAGYSPWGHKELDTTEWLSTTFLSLTHTHTLSVKSDQHEVQGNSVGNFYWRPQW